LRTRQHAVDIEPSGGRLGKAAGRCRGGERDARPATPSRPCAQVRTSKLAHQDRTGIVRKQSFLGCEGSALALLGFIAFRQNGCGTGRLVPPAIPDLDRRSGRVPALPYPPSKPRQYKPSSGWIAKNV